jgi:hypothetical protein
MGTMQKLSLVSELTRPIFFLAIAVLAFIQTIFARLFILKYFFRDIASDFKAEKLVDIEDGKIHITDVNKLQHLLY